MLEHKDSVVLERRVPICDPLFSPRSSRKAPRTCKLDSFHIVQIRSTEIADLHVRSC